MSDRIFVDDLDDPRIAVFRSLKRTNATRRGDLFVVEGAKLVERLQQSPFPLVSLLVSDRWEPRIETPSTAPVYVVPHPIIDDLVGFNFHQGVLGCGRRTPWPALDEIVGSDRSSTLVVCPDLANPENLGAIVRIADVFGVDAVIVGPHSPDPLSRRVLRVSMGTALRRPVLVASDLEAGVARLRSQLGFECTAAVVDPSAEALPAFRRPARLAVLLGNENTGLSPAWLARSDRRVTIPMREGAESLNVAVAAGILLYHLSRTGAPDTECE